MSEDRLSRKEIKHDIREDMVGTFLHDTVEKGYEKRNVLAKIAIAVVALVIGVVAVSAFTEKRATAAAIDLVDALEVYSAPLASDEGAEETEGPTFASAEARRVAAKEKLEAVRSRSGGGAATDVAGLYLAGLAVEEGDMTTARSLWQSFVDKHGDHLLAQSVRLNLISLDRDEGRGEDVVASLQAELEKSSKFMTEDVLLYELGRTLEALDRGDEAKVYFQRIVDEHASSPYLADARERTSDDDANPTLMNGSIPING